MLEHIRVQFAVGQGSFHGGFIRTESDSFLWIYDFGTSSADVKNNLHSCLERFCDLSPDHPKVIDTVFISHFDKDHVNGLQYLNEFKVKQFVIPDYNDVEKIILLSKLSSYKDTDGLQKLIVNPVQWLKDKFGNDCKVLLVTGNYSPESIGDNEESNIENSEIQAEAPQARVISMPWEKEGHEIIRPGSFKIGVGKSVIEFKFTPFWVKIRDEAIAVFEEFILAMFENSSDIQIDNLHQVLECLQNPDKYDDVKSFLRSMQNNLFGNVNVGSLCLAVTYNFNHTVFDVSYKLRQGDDDYCYPYYYHRKRNERSFGWIGTGDADFSTPKHFDEFYQAMKAYLPYAVTIQLPHHGCKHNFNAFNADKMPSIHNYVVSHGRPSHYNHPWKMFKPLIEGRNKRYISVHNQSDDLEEFIIIKNI